ncbi:MAG: hypothetical protein R3Y26_08975 [Rikenellaceae bacterium]
MKKYFPIVVIIIILTACNSNTQNKQYKEDSEKLQNLIEQLDTTNINGVPLGINFEEKFIDNRLNLIYLLDARCSACIGDFLHFQNIVQHLDKKYHIYGICNKSYEEIISYYIEVNNVENDNVQSTLLFTTEEYPYSQNPRFNILVVYNKKVVFRLLYASGRIFI